MKKGFTLAELLVVTFVVSLILGATIDLFLSAIASQKRNLAKQELLNQISFVLDYISRELRMAKKDDLEGENCLAGEKVNYEIGEEDKKIYEIEEEGKKIFLKESKKISFKNFEGKCQSFYFDEQSGTIKTKVWTSSKEEYDLPITSVKINLLKFLICGEEQGDGLQPRVTILLEAETKEKRPIQIKFQTTISQRDLDVSY